MLLCVELGFLNNNGRFWHFSFLAENREKAKVCVFRLLIFIRFMVITTFSNFTEYEHQYASSSGHFSAGDHVVDLANLSKTVTKKSSSFWCFFG